LLRHAARLDDDNVALHPDDRASYLAPLPVLHPDGPTLCDRTARLTGDDGSAPPRRPCFVRPRRPCAWRGKPRGWKCGVRSCRTAHYRLSLAVAKVSLSTQFSIVKNVMWLVIEPLTARCGFPWS
jgi:hypothetical protein